MPINPNEVQWESGPQIDPSRIVWDDEQPRKVPVFDLEESITGEPSKETLQMFEPQKEGKKKGPSYAESVTSGAIRGYDVSYGTGERLEPKPSIIDTFFKDAYSGRLPEGIGPFQEPLEDFLERAKPDYSLSLIPGITPMGKEQEKALQKKHPNLAALAFTAKSLILPGVSDKLASPQIMEEFLNKKPEEQSEEIASLAATYMLFGGAVKGAGKLVRGAMKRYPKFSEWANRDFKEWYRLLTNRERGVVNHVINTIGDEPFKAVHLSPEQLKFLKKNPLFAEALAKREQVRKGVSEILKRQEKVAKTKRLKKSEQERYSLEIAAKLKKKLETGERIGLQPSLVTELKKAAEQRVLPSPERGFELKGKPRPQPIPFGPKPVTKLRKPPVPKPRETEVTYKPKLSAGGKPYKTRESAQRIIDRQGLTAYEVVKRGEGFALQKKGRKIVTGERVKLLAPKKAPGEVLTEKLKEVAIPKLDSNKAIRELGETATPKQIAELKRLESLKIKTLRVRILGKLFKLKNLDLKDRKFPRLNL
jgi:hypothetical protein